MRSLHSRQTPHMRLRPLSLALVVMLSTTAFAVPTFNNTATTPNRAVGANVTQTLTLTPTAPNMPAVMAQAQTETVTISGTVTDGDTFSITLPGTATTITTTVAAGDTPASMATELYDLIVAHADYISNTTYQVTDNTSGVLTFTATTPGTSFAMSFPADAASISTNSSTASIDGAEMQANVPAVPAQSQIDTLTIGGSVDIGDVYSIDLPGSGTVSFTATTTSTADVAAGLNAAIQADSGVPYATQDYTTSVTGSDIVFTAKSAGTGWTLGATGSTNATAVAQVNTLTPASIMAGNTFAVTLNGTTYTFVATTTSATDVVNGLIAAIPSTTVTPTLNTGTLVLTANTPGTAFTAVAAAVDVATAAQSTLTVGTSSLITAGSTSAILTLKDASSTSLFNVSASGATITSNSSSCTVGTPTRSTTDGTVTATITAVSPGSCIIGATLNGSTAVTATQAITVTAANTTITGGTGTIDGTGTITGSASVTVTAGSSVDVSANGASGSTLTIDASTKPVSVNLGGSTPSVSVSTGSSGVVLKVSTTSGGQNVVGLSQGSATLSSGSSGAILSVGGSGESPIVITSGSTGSAITATANSGGTTTVAVVSGTVTTPHTCGSRPAIPATPPTGSRSSTWNTYFSSVKVYQRELLAYSLCIAQLPSVNLQRSLISDRANMLTSSTLMLFKGETITYDSAGNEIGVTLADGGAGVAQTLSAIPTGMTLESIPVSIDGNPARLNGSYLGTEIVTTLSKELGIKLTRSANTPIGGMVMTAPDGTRIAGVPVGQLMVAPGVPNGLQSNGRMRVVVRGAVTELAPSLVSPSNFAAQLMAVDSQATGMVTADGLIKATVGGAKYVVRPAWTATPSTLNGFSYDSAGRLIHGDGSVQQTLYPAFANIDVVAATLSTIIGASVPAVDVDGSVTTTIGNVSYKLRAGYMLVNTPEAHAADTWWQDGSTFYINNQDGTAQSFSVE
ncbi:hypothetical protein GCM10007907_09580 [Chitinimonas prasina]|uniref:Uncharacterized protein n=2 Tax=Chitinimonas prasina TaxID=1434937 RepID=A0ABQ5YDT8_9NEIS|nr:hypothetical protein GCM10007907_09580 [Chitinimonas prasina]